MKIDKYKVLLLGIIILAAVLRLWNLSQYPAGLNADEASLGYNAYSLLQTGKDEYGASWPLVFKSFGDFKPGLYVYLAMPFVATLGLNEWAVRLPSALLGIATVYLIYLLGKRLFNSPWAGLLSALLLAISPWHLQYSRGGWESNAATFFIALGVLWFLKGMENVRYWFFSGVAFLISMYLYQSPRLIVPAFILSLLLLYRKEIFPRLKKFAIYLPVLLILLIPLGLQFTSGVGSSRLSGLSFWADPGPISRVNELRGEDPSGKLAGLLHNKLTAYGPSWLGHYLDHFNSQFLFIRGDEVIRNKVPEMGQFYLICALLLAAGIYLLIKDRVPHAKLLLAWILTAPLASSLTFQTPSALRSLSMVVPLTLVMGYGFEAFFQRFKGIQKVAILGFITAALLFEFIHYLDAYYVIYPQKYPLAWEYGFSQMVPKLEEYQDQYKKVVITDRYDQPYILVLFYEKYNPAKYQPQAHLTERDKFNFGTVRSFDKYEFRAIDPKEVQDGKDILYIGTPEQIPANAKIIDKVLFPNGKPAFVFAGT